MCKVGDIILVNSPKANGVNIGTHPFLVVNANGGNISGMPFDNVSLLMSSMTDDYKLNKCCVHIGSFPVSENDKNVITGYDNKDAFVNTTQLFYFNESKISYVKLGTMDQNVLADVLSYIVVLSNNGIPFESYLDNL